MLGDARVRLAAAFGALALLAALSWRCAASKDGAASVNAPALVPDAAAPPTPAEASRDRSSGQQPAATAEVPAASAGPSQATPAPGGSASAAVAAGGTTSGASAVIAAVAQRDPRDLALLARIERELKRDPPAPVHALIRRREAGASRSELMSHAAAELPPNDMQLRVLVQRWIDEVAPDPARPAPPAAAPSGSARPLVHPIERAAP